MAEEFQLVAGHLALDFANTLDYRYDPDRLVDLLPTYERFLAVCRQAAVIDKPQMKTLLANTSEPEAQRTLTKAIEFRESLHLLVVSAVDGRGPDESSLQAFNLILADAQVPHRLQWEGESFIRSYRGLAASPAGPLWWLVDSSAVLLTSPDLCHIRKCREETCRWLFLDRSRNHSRRWCDMRLCGNRSKARRFYANTRSGA
jgi:predicted RNA-binding Zn ribbon-like protein